MPSPNFLIIGAQKSGSSWLARHLRQHPEVFLARGELHFFDKDFNFARGREWYESHFAGATGERAIGEKTPDYLWANGLGAEGHLPDVHRNIHAYYPDAKLIVVMRNPVTRAVSAVHHMIRSGRCSPLHRIDDLLIGSKRHLLERHGIIEKGRYHEQIAAYLDYFPREQFLFLFFEEDVLKTPHETLALACEFLGVDRGFDFGRVNQAVNEFNRSIPGLAVTYYFRNAERVGRFLDRRLPHEKKKPRPETIARLHALYAEDNEKLFALVGRRIEAWAPKQVPALRPAAVGSELRPRWAIPARGLAAAAVLALAVIPLGYWAARRASPGAASGGSAVAMAAGPTRTAAQLTATPDVEEAPTWSPDGRRLAYVGSVGGHKQLFIRALADGATRRLSARAADEIQPAWSADGRRLAFVRARAREAGSASSGAWGRRPGDIWTVDLESGQERKLVANAFAPAYSPDGRRLAFDASRDGSRRIWVANADGGGARPVTDAPSADVVDTDPQWSPEGDRLVFRRTDRGQTDILMLDLAAGKTVKLTDDAALDMDAVWSPSGRHIYFSSSREGGLDLWRIELDRDGNPIGHPERLTSGPGDEVHPAVAPDGRRIAFAVRDYPLDPGRSPHGAAPNRLAAQDVVETGAPDSLLDWPSQSPEDRWAPFGGTRRGGDLWVLDGV